jgi:hypothetical protein
VTLKSDLRDCVMGAAPEFEGRVYADGAGDTSVFPHAVITVDTDAVPALRGDAQVLYWQRSGRIEVFFASDDDNELLVSNVRRALQHIHAATVRKSTLPGWRRARNDLAPAIVYTLDVQYFLPDPT